MEDRSWESSLRERKRKVGGCWHRLRLCCCVSPEEGLGVLHAVSLPFLERMQFIFLLSRSVRFVLYSCVRPSVRSFVRPFVRSFAFFLFFSRGSA